MSDVPQGEEYFELLAQCAIKTMGEMAPDVNPDAFWRVRCGKAWRDVYQHMTKPSKELAAGMPTAYRRTMALRFAALSREAAMAAYILGIVAEDRGQVWQDIERALIEMGHKMPPII